ncbi:MAG: hypothetical protein A2Y73_08745, partial [Chloroflexi bacterium RBG_13_56_8]
CELVDIFLAEYVAPLDFARATTRQAPTGLVIREVEEVPLKGKNPQSTMREAHYRVCVSTSASESEIGAAIQELLSRPHIVRQRLQKRRLKEYDLRPLILDVALCPSVGDAHQLHMELCCGPLGAARPEEVLEEMGMGVYRYTIHRVRLLWGNGEEN